MKKNLIILFALIIAIGLTGCSPAANGDDLASRVEELEATVSNLQAELEIYQAPSSVLQASLNVVEALDEQDMERLAKYVHPDKGVRFTPYAYVDLENDQLFTAQELEELLNDNTVYTWGQYDGKGDPIELTFSNYYERFVYDVDFANPDLIGNNVQVGDSTTINNINDAYPNGTFVEYHFTGFDPEFEGMDWRSLRLVFEEDNDTWLLVGIVHDEWTI